MSRVANNGNFNCRPASMNNDKKKNPQKTNPRNIRKVHMREQLFGIFHSQAGQCPPIGLLNCGHYSSIRNIQCVKSAN